MAQATALREGFADTGSILCGKKISGKPADMLLGLIVKRRFHLHNGPNFSFTLSSPFIAALSVHMYWRTFSTILISEISEAIAMGFSSCGSTLDPPEGCQTHHRPFPRCAYMCMHGFHHRRAVNTLSLQACVTRCKVITVMT